MNSNIPSRPVLEVSIGYLLILATVWTPNPYQRVLFWVSFAVIVALCLVGRARGERLGLGVSGLVGSLWAVFAAGVLAAVAIEVANLLHTLHPFFGHSLLGVHAWGYLIWALLQQLILQSFILTRLLTVFPERSTAVLVAALMFSLAHVPNMLLVFTTLAWGLAACALFLRYRNLYTLGIIHFIFGVAVAVCVPSAIHHNMRVGLGYYFYRSGAVHHLAASNQDNLAHAKAGRSQNYR